MLKEYLENLTQARQHHPITQADFDAWKQNIITKQLFEDLELALLEQIQSMRALDSNAGLSLAKFNGMQESVQSVTDWVPETLESAE